jgi:hypothetical protein
LGNYYSLLGFPPVISAAQQAENAADKAAFDADPNTVYPAVAAAGVGAGAGGAIKAGPSKPNKTDGTKYFECEFEINATPLPPRVYKLKENLYYNKTGGYGSMAVKEFNKSYGARFSTGIYTRGCHWIPRMFA